MFKQFNANPINKRVGDCTVRAISKVLNQSWADTYSGMAIQGFMQCDMPSANTVWGSYLKSKGFIRRLAPDEQLENYTVNDFCNDHPRGIFLLALQGHVVASVDGDYYDTWDSGDEIVNFYWERKED